MGNHQGKTLKLGSYHLHFVKQIAEGGFSYVYLVKDSNSKLYALKRILIRDNDELAKVKNEINIMQKLSKHRNIVKYIDYTKTSSHNKKDKDKDKESEIFILMEYCSGGHLVEIMQKRQMNRFSDQEILRIFSEICESVAFMHSQTPLIIHRDLKVENVLLDEDSGLYKLCDFGSATEEIYNIKGKQDMQRAEDDISKNTTLQYRAPEIVDLYRCSLINEKIDIWALGCLLYKLLYYTTPFEDSGSLGILNCNYQLPPPGNHPNYSNDLVNLIRIMLNPDPNQRPNIFEITNQVHALLKGVNSPPLYPKYKSNILSSPTPPPKPLPQIPTKMNNQSLGLGLSSSLGPPTTTATTQNNTSTTTTVNTTDDTSNLSPSLSRSDRSQSTTQQPTFSPHSPPTQTKRRNASTANTPSSTTPSLFGIPLPSSHKNENPLSLDDSTQQQQDNTNTNFIEEVSFLINSVINTNENSFDASLISKLKTYTNIYRPTKGIMSVIIKKTLREPLICFKSLLLIQMLLSEGTLAFRSDAFDNKDLFYNLHLGWLKQKDKYSILGELLSNYSLLLHKLVLFYTRYPIIDGTFSFNEMKWGLPDSYDIQQQQSNSTFQTPISITTISMLIEILEQILLVSNSIIEYSNNSANSNNAGSSPEPIQPLPISLLVHSVNILNSVSYSIYCFISACLETLSQLNLPDLDFKFQNSILKFQTTHQHLRDQYSKLYMTPIFSDQFFPTLANNPPQFNIKQQQQQQAIPNTDSTNPFSNTNNMEPSFNPFSNSNSNDNFFEPSTTAGNPLGVSTSPVVVTTNVNGHQSVVQSTISPPVRAIKGLPLRFPHSASLEDARLYTLILTPTASPPLSPSLGRLGHSHSNVQNTIDINQQVYQQQNTNGNVPPQSINNNSNGNAPKFLFPQPQSISHTTSLNNSYNNLFTPPQSLNSSYNPFDTTNLGGGTPNPSTSGHGTPNPYPPQQQPSQQPQPQPQQQTNSKQPTFAPPPALKPRGHRRSQSSTTDDVRRRNLLQQQLDQNKEFLRHQRQINMKNNQAQDLLTDDISGLVNDDEEDSSLL
ncbi:putative protein serine/threonine kinase [Tieghemostelium lacteum]|uniref:Protein kinase domain-containing protein n=1 Tax=Tieghemostelium lacteum TaxID=361077 RepID=A0A152A465_TIELA|nr:putative protein serine/threonine kinase [Tieghemostelium lacteum]|eukprot:KYR00851.1 putative protein serine/threonine kinase [Tieghemostelium lacteum]